MYLFRERYTKATWYHKHVAKERADLFEVEPHVSVLLNHVTDTAVAVLPGNSPHDFEDSDDNEEDDNRPATVIVEMFREPKPLDI